jgi:hypothetical protein
MRETKSAHLAGTTGATVTMHVLIPLTDPDGLGNQGLTGFNEDDVTQSAPDAAAARVLGDDMYAALKREHPEREVEWLRVTTFRYDRTVWDDFDGEPVLDAEQVIVTHQDSFSDNYGVPVWNAERLP